jgi:hypothetical protein
MLVLPVILFMTGSRAMVVVIGLAILLQTVRWGWILRHPGRAFGWLMLGLLAAAAFLLGAFWLFSRELLERMTDVKYAMHSIGVRWLFIREAVSHAVSHPLGAGMGAWRGSTGHAVHTDLFFLLSNLGWLGATLYVALMVGLWRTVRKIPGAIDRWYAGVVVLYLVLAGLGHTWVMMKFFWTFLAVPYVLLALWRHHSALQAAQPAGPPAGPA